MPGDQMSPIDRLHALIRELQSELVEARKKDATLYSIEVPLSALGSVERSLREHPAEEQAIFESIRTFFQKV